MKLLFLNTTSTDNKVFFDLVLDTEYFQQGISIYHTVDHLMMELPDLQDIVVAIRMNEFGEEIIPLLISLQARRIPYIARVSEDIKTKFLFGKDLPFIIPYPSKKEETWKALNYCIEALEMESKKFVIEEAMDDIVKVILGKENSIMAIGKFKKEWMEMKAVNDFHSEKHGATAHLIDKTNRHVIETIGQIMASKFAPLFAYIDKSCIVLISEIAYVNCDEKIGLHCKNGSVLKVSRRKIHDFVSLCEAHHIPVINKVK